VTLTLTMFDQTNVEDQIETTKNLSTKLILLDKLKDQKSNLTNIIMINII